MDLTKGRAQIQKLVALSNLHGQRILQDRQHHPQGIGHRLTNLPLMKPGGGWINRNDPSHVKRTDLRWGDLFGKNLKLWNHHLQAPAVSLHHAVENQLLSGGKPAAHVRLVEPKGRQRPRGIPHGHLENHGAGPGSEDAGPYYPGPEGLLFSGNKLGDRSEGLPVFVAAGQMIEEVPHRLDPQAAKELHPLGTDPFDVLDGAFQGICLTYESTLSIMTHHGEALRTLWKGAHGGTHQSSSWKSPTGRRRRTQDHRCFSPPLSAQSSVGPNVPGRTDPPDPGLHPLHQEGPPHPPKR